MEKQKLIKLHKAISECTYNLESASREWLKYNVAPGVKSPSQILIESSRNRIHELIDEVFNSETNGKVKKSGLITVAKSGCRHNGDMFNPQPGQVVCGQCLERLE